MQKISAVRIMIAANTILVVAYLFARAISFGANSGDIAVWTTLHELIQRHHSIYTTVWDHKDLGFYIYPHLLYQMLQIQGLYLFGILSTILYGFGAFLLAKRLFSIEVSITLALTSIVIFTSFESYLAPYVENTYLGFATLGLSLVFSFPFVAGLLLAIATTIKVSAIFIWAGCLAAIYISTINNSKIPKRNIFLYIAGFALGAGMAIGYAWHIEALGKWLEVIQYNQFYAHLRKDNIDAINRILLAFVNASTPVRALCISTLACLIFASWKIYLSKTKETSVAQTFLLLFTFADSSLLILFLQTPPAFQHFLILIGPLAICFIISLGYLIAGFFNTGQNLIGAEEVMLVVMTCLTVPVYAHGNVIQSWENLNSPGELLNEFAQLRSPSTVIIFAGNKYRIDLRSAPDQVKLSCRFYYHYEHLEGFYKNKLAACYQQTADYLIIEKGYLENSPIRHIVEKHAIQDYSDCDVNNTNFKIYSKEADCGTLTLSRKTKFQAKHP